MTPLNSIIQLSSMIEVQLSGLQNSKPSSVLDAENKQKSKKKSLSKESIKQMTDCAVIIWSNSKLLEYMTIS
jgi:hypothetical protein